jgi:DNA-binding transcriptional regulator YiaG
MGTTNGHVDPYHRFMFTALPTPTSRRQIRVLAGASQRDVAFLCGVTQPSVSAWEQGRQRPRPFTRDLYLLILGKLLLKALAEF